MRKLSFWDLERAPFHIDVNIIVRPDCRVIVGFGFVCRDVDTLVENPLSILVKVWNHGKLRVFCSSYAW